MDASMSQETSIEQDIKELMALDEQMGAMVERRYVLVDRIQGKHHRNSDQMMKEKDWYEGAIRGNPVPDRAHAPEEGMTENTYSEVARPTPRNGNGW